MQRIHIQSRPPIHRRNGELLVIVIQRLFAHVADLMRHEAVAHRGPGAIGGDAGHRVGVIDAPRFLVAHFQRVAFRAQPQAQLPKLQRHIRMCRGRTHQCPVELGAIDGVDDFLGPHAIGLQLSGAIMLMHHAPAHGDGEPHHLVEHTRELEPAYPASRQREIDRPPGIRGDMPRVEPSLIHGDLEPAPRQHDRQQGPREPGANYVDAARRRQAQVISLSAAASSSTNSCTSTKRLYKGIGVTRMMSGSRQSHTMP